MTTMLPKFSRDDDFLDFYCEQGYVILTDVFSVDELERVRDDIFRLFDIRFRHVNTEGLSGLDLLSFYYQREQDLWRQSAKRMYDLPSILGLVAKPEVGEVLGRLGLTDPIISTRPEVRTDMPADQQYMQPWHQDWRYGQGSLNALTFWIPLHAVGVHNGTVEVAPKTHLWGYLESEELANPRRFAIVDARVQDLVGEPVELDLGECVIFSQWLVHRSGYNQTETPRVTVQLRFSDLSEPAYLANGISTPVTSELLWERTPSEQDVRRIFTAVDGGGQDG